MYKEIKRRIYNDPIWMSNNPDNFEYGMAFIAVGVAWIFLVLTMPIWGLVWLLGKITR